ncbi:MAG TPA: dTDP-4-dehydrorhamnose 3,5-epimerase family protein, partial [Caldimonas sp.]
MEVTPTALAGVLIIQPKVFADARGFFLESFNQRQFDTAVGAPVAFVQDNHSRSAQGVLRGLHLQLDPHAQGKLVRVTKGRIFD